MGLCLDYSVSVLDWLSVGWGPPLPRRLVSGCTVILVTGQQVVERSVSGLSWVEIHHHRQLKLAERIALFLLFWVPQPPPPNLSHGLCVGDNQPGPAPWRLLPLSLNFMSSTCVPVTCPARGLCVLHVCCHTHPRVPTWHPFVGQPSLHWPYSSELPLKAFTQ